MAEINKCIRGVSYDASRSPANKINEEPAMGTELRLPVSITDEVRILRN